MPKEIKRSKKTKPVITGNQPMQAPQPQRYTQELSKFRETLVGKINDNDLSSPAKVEAAKQSLEILRTVDSPYW